MAVRLQRVCNNVVMDGKGRAAGQQQKSVGASGSSRRKQISQQSNNKTERKGGGNGKSNANRSRLSRAQGSSGRRGCTKNKNNAVHIVESGNFQSNYHAKLCTAAKYKVHAPLCSCPKVVKLRNQYQKQQQRAQQSDNDNGVCAEAKNVINSIPAAIIMEKDIPMKYNSILMGTLYIS